MLECILFSTIVYYFRDGKPMLHIIRSDTYMIFKWHTQSLFFIIQVMDVGIFKFKKRVIKLVLRTRKIKQNQKFFLTCRYRKVHHSCIISLPIHHNTIYTFLILLILHAKICHWIQNSGVKPLKIHILRKNVLL